MTPPTEDHFTELVCHGALPAPSSGCVAALALAKAVIEHAPVLDGPACAGLMKFIGYVRKNPGSAAEWLRENAPTPPAIEAGEYYDEERDQSFPTIDAAIEDKAVGEEVFLVPHIAARGIYVKVTEDGYEIQT